MKRLPIAGFLFFLSWVAIPEVSSQTIPAAAPPLSPAEAESKGAGLSLTEAANFALKRNPSVRATSSGRDMADAQLEEARAGRWPLVQFSETFTRSNNPVFVFGSLLEQHRFTAQNFDIGNLNNPDALNNWRSALTLKMPIFDQLETGTRIAQARIGQEQADRQKDLVEQQVRLEVIRTYFGVSLARARREVADEAVRMSEADMERIRNLFHTGMVVQSDLLAAEVQAAEFRQQRVQAAGDVVTAHAALNTVMGLPVNAPHNLSGRLADKNFELGDLDHFFRQALTNRPEYARAGATIQSAEKQVSGAKGKYLPRVDLFSTYGASGKDLMTSGGPDYAVGAGLTYNLFELGRGAKLDQARAALAMANFEQERLGNQIRLEVVQAYQQYLSSRERLGLAARSVAQAEEALRIVRDRYQEGLTIITEVLRAQTAYVRTRMTLLWARYEVYVGYAQLLVASGRLTDMRPFES